MTSNGVELIWPGKYVDGARAPLEDRGAQLVERERFDDQAATSELILGDNLLALEALVRERPQSADLVYIDPPFATGSQFALVRRIGDKARGDEQTLRLPAFDDAWEGGAGGLLRMLDPRLRLLHRLLAPTGSLYLHVDPTVGHAVKLLLDDVFGPGCFQREIVWRIGWLSGYKTRARNWIRNHDLIFFYVKDPSRFTFNKRYVPHPEGYRRRDGKPSKAPGVPIEDVWNANAVESELSGRASLDSIQIKSFSREKTGWATQKNESLLERIIAASSDPGDTVVDVFAGSGTTGVVAASLGRRFVLCDHAEAAVQIARGRLLDAGVEDFRVCTLDARERAVWAEGGEPRTWALAQLEGQGIEHPVLSGERGTAAIAIAELGEVVDGARVEALATAAAAAGYATLELLAFDWDRRPLPSTAIPVVCLEPTRGFWDASVRARSWLSGGWAIRERPRVDVEFVRDGSLTATVRRVEWRARERLPTALADRPLGDHLVGWTLAPARAPTRPRIVARRGRGREPLALTASAPWPPDEAEGILGIDDVLGARHVYRLRIG